MCNWKRERESVDFEYNKKCEHREQAENMERKREICDNLFFGIVRNIRRTLIFKVVYTSRFPARRMPQDYHTYHLSINVRTIG